MSPYDLDPNSIKPGAMRSMTTDKLASFSLGGTKKTAFERRKEELAAKRREQEAALAAEHARFVEEFESGPERPTKQFVRGGVQGGDVGASSSGRPAAPTGPRISAPQRRGPSAAARAAFQPDAIDGESLDAEPPKPPPSAAGRLAAAPARKGKDRGPSQMEEFMMELRREQEERDSRGERDSDVRKSDAPTSFDNQDPDTTNLYIGNLSPNVSEEALFRSFQHFGAIQSVKIMWPRSEDERLTKRLNGFVAFVKRADAARAKDEMNETELLGYVMRIGWGKTVARPTQPITLASIQARASSAASSLPVPGGAPRPTGVAPEAVSVPPNHEIIDRLALFVAQEGHPFEQEVMSREAENPSYRFLYDRGSAEHRYYRWKVVSLCCGDSVDAWDTASFRLQPDGPLWAPPPCSRPPPARDVAAKRSRSPSRSPSRSRSRSRSPPRSRSRSRSRSPPARGRKFDRDNHARGLERGRSPEGGRELSEEERDELEDLLRAMVVERQVIADGMGWCVARSTASSEIVETITEALTLSETPAPKKIARLFLVSDILHNAGTANVPGASSFRSHFQRTLPEMFESLHGCLMGLDSRMGVETMKDQVVKVLYIWQAWSLFPLSYLSRLERTLLHGAPDAAKPAAGAEPPADRGDDSDEDDVDGEPMYPPAASSASAREEASSAQTTTAPAAPAAAAVSPLEERVRALSLRQLEAVCEANGVSSSGSRAEMLSRLLARGAAGHPIDFGGEAPPEAPPPQQLSPPPQQLSVPTRWDGDEAEDIDGDDIDGEDIDGEGVAPPAAAEPKGESKAEGRERAPRGRSPDRASRQDRPLESKAERRDGRERGSDRRRSRSRERARSRERSRERARSRERSRERARSRSRERRAPDRRGKRSRSRSRSAPDRRGKRSRSRSRSPRRGRGGSRR